MSLRPVELRQIVDELNTQLVGAVVQKAFAPLPRLLYLEVRQIGRTTLWCLCAEAELARIGLADARLPTPNPPPPFQARVRQELIGARLVSARFHESARALELSFIRMEKERSLWLELPSAGANLVLVVSGKTLSFSAEPRPGVRVGQPYSPNSLEPLAADQPSRLVSVEGEPLGLSRAAEQLLAAREVGHRADDLRRRLMAPLKAKLQRTVRTLEKVKAEARRQDDAEAHRQTGELLAQNLFRVTRGQKEIVLTRYTESGPVEERVVLDPKRTPKEQVDWHFHQYRRLLRGCEHAARREVELTHERDALTQELAELKAAPDEELLGRTQLPPRPKPSAGPQRARPYKEYAGSGGRIWVGKGSEGNDALTFKIARPQDIWFHARGVPGSHVVVPLERGVTLPQELLLDAAHLALHHSNAKGEPRGEVSYTQAKFVRKQKGGAPGQVIYTREKTLLVRIEKDRLERLLRASET